MLVTDMFWYLLLAHFLGDYPLQTDWMVKFKSKWFGLGSHIVAHVFSTYLIVFFIGGQGQSVLGYLFGLILCHLGIDMFKNYLAKQYPNNFVATYLFDQFLHIVSIAFVVYLMHVQGVINVEYIASTDWAVYALGLVLVTDVWRITERIFCCTGLLDLPPVVERMPHYRMVGRALLFCSLVWLSWSFLSFLVIGLALFSLFVIYWVNHPDRPSLYHFVDWMPWHLLSVDLTISSACALFIGISIAVS